MSYLTRLIQSDIVMAGIIIIAGLFSASFVVFADDASTSVTVGNSSPVVSSVSFNGGNNLTLTENTFVHATATMTVSDSNGCSDISSVNAQLAFAASVGAADGGTCSYDANTCYIAHSCTATTTGNTCTGGADTSVEYDCSFEVWYPARPTDGSSPGLSAAIWYVAATSTDGSGSGTATNTSETIDIATLNSINITSSISYPATSAGGNTGATNQTVTH